MNQNMAERHLGRVHRRSKKRQLPLHLMLIPGIVLMIVFHYVPLAGLVVAFQRFIPAKGLFGDQTWIGLGNFEYIFSMPNTLNVIRNTLVMAVGKIVLNFLTSITVALLLNELTNRVFKRTVQTVIYFPHFLSWIVFGAILVDLLSPSEGIVNRAITALGGEPVYFLGSNVLFQPTIILTGVWKDFGYGTVVYLASLSGIDPTLYEAASIDGAGYWKRMVHITLPGLRMIIVLMMVLNLGGILNAGFDQVFNMYNPIVYRTGDIIDTMVYRLGLESAKYGPASAVGLFKSVVSLVLISTSYFIAYKFFDYSLF